jgi:hypothetical protein
MRTLKRPIAGAAVIALLGCAPAFADGRSYCGWQQGVYVCQSTYETDYAVTTTLCGSGGIDAACSTKTKLKEPPPPPAPLPLAREQASGGTLILRGSNTN